MELKMPRHFYDETNPNTWDVDKSFEKYKWRMRDLSCSICRPHRGCNRTVYYRRSWKHYRKHQYKPVVKGGIDD